MSSLGEMEACNSKKTFFQDLLWFISCFTAGNLINVISNLILFLFWNSFVPFVKEKCRLERKGSHCVGLPSHCWQAASHFSLGVIQMTLKKLLLQQNHKKTNRWSDPASFWKGLDFPPPHTCVYLPEASFHLPYTRACPVSPYLTVSSCSWKSQHEPFSICSHPVQCCKGQPSSVCCCATERGECKGLISE